MNIFTTFTPASPPFSIGSPPDGRLPTLDYSRFVVEPPKDASLGDLASNAAMVFAKEAKPHFPNPRELATEIAAELARVGRRRAGRGRGTGLHQHPAQAVHLRRCAARRAARARRFRPRRKGQGRGAAGQGQRRICLGQSDRPDACRPWSRRGLRRRPRQSARIFRLRGDARILHQRRRRAGRCAGPLRLPPLPRGARRDDRHSRRPLSRRLSQARRRGAREDAWPRAARQAGERMAADRARRRHRRDDGDDPRRSRRAQHHA